MTVHPDERGRRAPTPTALASLSAVPDGYRILPDPLHGQPLLRVPARPAEVRLLLDRSHESAQAGEPTQDYLALRCDPRRLTFAVTDGVGSSFLGDVAAQILAAQLTDWLAPGRSTRGGDQFDSSLTRFLTGLSRAVLDRVANWPIPASASGLVRSALDQQRAYGSEAMFAAGVVDLTGGREATLTVAWLGDAVVRVVLRDGRRIDHRGETTDRWSSRLGPRGTVRSRAWPVAEVARVIVCTDGVIPELDATVELADAPLAKRLRELAQRPGNDDIALIDVGLAPRAIPGGEPGAGSPLWRRLTEEPAGRHARSTSAGSALRRLIRAVGPSTPSTPDAPVSPAPAGEPPPLAAAAPPPVSMVEEEVLLGIDPPARVRWRQGERGAVLTWSPVDGADGYAVQLCEEPTFAEPLLYVIHGLTFALPPIPGVTFVRVRCVVAGEPGPWGGAHDLSHPPPGDDTPDGAP